jgi:hypothetical protein
MKTPIAALFLWFSIGVTSAQERGEHETEMTTAERVPAAEPVGRTTALIMAHVNFSQPSDAIVVSPKFEQPDRSSLSEAPAARPESPWPTSSESPLEKSPDAGPSAPQPVTLNFNAVTGPTETGSFRPHTMGVAGLTQFFLFVNGRMRTFNKTTGVADGVINADPDTFFASVKTAPAAGEIVLTNYPNVRYDRLSGRWFLTMVDQVLVAATGATARPNRVLLAVSDSASAGIITAGTVWTLYQFQGDGTLVIEDPSLGVDASALYIGANMLTVAGAFESTKGFVIPKAPMLSATSLTVWQFSGLVPTPTGAGPFSPRGVDNFDPANTGATALGYFIGVDNFDFSKLMIRRVTNPGSLGPSPTISANISVTTPSTRFPVLVPHLGNTGGTGGRLDAVDDRLYAAHLRNGRLWTAHNIGVNNTGVAGATNNRNAVRWYELQNLNATPSLQQLGTLFDNTAPNDANQRNYWMPSIMVSGQGHAALGCSIAGANERINAFTTGRLIGDTLGQLRNGPGGAALPGYTAVATAYNPPGDSGGPSRGWGEYSFTSLDPKDDMTMWTIQEYCNGTNTHGCRVARLAAPPPATPASANPAIVPRNDPSTIVTITGTSVSGSGFYDPGTAGFAIAPNRISAAIPGVIISSITDNNPTQITLDVSTIGSAEGLRNVTVTNPDGQAITGTGILRVADALQVTGATSPMAHGGAGTFAIPLPLTGEPGVECRSSSGSHTMLFSFSNDVVSGSASVTDGTGGVSGAPVFAGNTMRVNLSGVSDVQKITVTLTNVTDNFGQVLPSAVVSMNMLIGDTNGSKAVNATDIGQAKAQSGVTVTNANFRQDVTPNGTINASDIGLVKSGSGASVP